jgi:hypothetical protein
VLHQLRRRRVVSLMPRFRSRPFEIEAVQWNEDGDHPAVEIKQTTAGEPIAWVVRGHQGNSQVNPGDWIIAEPDGDGFYPCDPDTFERKYESID